LHQAQGGEPGNAFCAASAGGHDQVVKLLEKDADIAIANKDDWTPLNLTSSNGHLKVVKLVLEEGTDVNVLISIQSYSNAFNVWDA
jgi:ankyrin repeat protein